MRTRLFLFFIPLILATIIAGAQAPPPPPFWNDIQHFKAQDSVRFPPKKAILFVGSSSFTKWTDVQEYFPGYPIINRGFGGSTLTDLIRYRKDVITPYKAKQIVIYCGENDIASSDSITAEIVFQRFKTLFNEVRKRQPFTAIAFVSLKPSPSREKFWPEMVRTNQLVKDFLATKKNTAFIDVYPAMFNPDGSIMRDLFIEDNLHMNSKGYDIWQKLIESHLIK